jgi:hypothetical protein
LEFVSTLKVLVNFCTTIRTKPRNLQSFYAGSCGTAEPSNAALHAGWCKSAAAPAAADVCRHRGVRH